MITLRDIYEKGPPSVQDVGFLYDLLRQRPSEANISHKQMPTLRTHTTFVNRKPYLDWRIVEHHGERSQRVGAIYLTDRREVGIHFIEGARHMGFGRQAMIEFRKLHPGPMLANVAPGNGPSNAFFRSLGAEVIQLTYELK